MYTLNGLIYQPYLYSYVKVFVYLFCFLCYCTGSWLGPHFLTGFSLAHWLFTDSLHFWHTGFLLWFCILVFLDWFPHSLALQFLALLSAQIEKTIFHWVIKNCKYCCLPRYCNKWLLSPNSLETTHSVHLQLNKSDCARAQVSLLTLLDTVCVIEITAPTQTQTWRA